MESRKNLSSYRMRRIKVALVFSSSYLVVAAITAILTHSLALLSEAGHMIVDVGGLILALCAINYTCKPATQSRTYGFYRMEILASLANGVILVTLSMYILYEGVRRIFAPPEILSFPMIIVAAVGIIMNFFAMRYLGGSGGHIHSHTHIQGISNSGDEEHVHFHGDIKSGEQKGTKGNKTEEENLNVKAAYVETLSDTLGAAGVMVAALIIQFTKFYLADPVISIGLALFILPRTFIIMRKAINILMEGHPDNISYEEVKREILKIRGVTGVFDLHIWTITSGMNSLSAHVVTINRARSESIQQEINSLLEKRFKIVHATIQIERYHSESDTF